MNKHSSVSWTSLVLCQEYCQIDLFLTVRLHSSQVVPSTTAPVFLWDDSQISSGAPVSFFSTQSSLAAVYNVSKDKPPSPEKFLELKQSSFRMNEEWATNGSAK